MRPSRPDARPWLAFIGIAVITMLGLAALAQLKFSAALADSVGERMAIVATTAANDLGAAIDLGLRLDEIANGEQILERARVHDPTISRIAVFDLDGDVLHTVGEGPAAEIHPRTHEAFRVVVLEGIDDRWSDEVNGLVRSGAVVAGSFGQPLGGVVVHYPVTEMRRQEAAMLEALLVDAGLIGVLLLAIVGGGLLVHTRFARPVPTDRTTVT